MKIILSSSGKSEVFSGKVSANLILDCRVMRNPFRDPVLGGLTGDDPKVQDWIRGQNKDLVGSFYQAIEQAAETLPTRGGHKEGDPLKVHFFCLAGVHRSRGMKNVMGQVLKDKGYNVEVL